MRLKRILLLSFILFSLVFSISLFGLVTYGFKKVVPSIINGQKYFKSLLLFFTGLFALCVGWSWFYSLLIEQIDLSSIKSGSLPIFGDFLKVLYFLVMFVFTILMPVFMLIIYIAIFIVMLLNFIFWTLSKGVFRFLYEHEIIKNRKVLSAIGLFCLAIAFPTLSNLEKIGKILEKIF